MPCCNDIAFYNAPAFYTRKKSHLISTIFSTKKAGPVDRLSR